jgi:hypothetical protein
VLVLWVFAHVYKRKHSHGRFIRQGEGLPIITF